MHFSDLPEIERQAIDLLLEGDSESLKILRKQVALIKGVERTESGAGVYVVFTLDESAERVEGEADFHLADVSAVSGTCEEIEFILFIKEGLIEYLEGYVYSDVYPAYADCNFRLKRADTSR